VNYRTPASLLVVILALVLLSQSLFIVPQGRIGVTRRMQSSLVVGLTPGLHYKLPFMDSALELDAGGITLDGSSLNGGDLKFATVDGQTLQAGYFAVWHITDPAVFCSASACDEEATASRLNLVVVPALRDVFKTLKLDAALASQGRLAQGLPGVLNPGVASMGVRFERIDLTGVTLPPAGLEDVYTRMRSVDEAETAKVRAEAAAATARSHAATDAERERILATADAASARIRAGGEADAAAIYAVASRQEPDFFSFFRGLTAYRRGLVGQTVWVLDADSPYLKYLKIPPK
jgi:modulator of FtsH protease HflC